MGQRGRLFLKERGIPAHPIQLVWDAIALHTTRCIALHKEPEVAMTHSGIAVDVIKAGLDLIPHDKACAVLAQFPPLSMKKRFRDCFCSLVRQKPGLPSHRATVRFQVMFDVCTLSQSFAWPK